MKKNHCCGRFARPIRIYIEKPTDENEFSPVGFSIYIRAVLVFHEKKMEHLRNRCPLGKND